MGERLNIYMLKGNQLFILILFLWCAVLSLQADVSSAFSPECVRERQKDELTKQYISPLCTVWKYDGNWKYVNNEEILFTPNNNQPKPNGKSCYTMTSTDNEIASILLDYGKELYGGLQLALESSSQDKPILVRIRFGRYVGECHCQALNFTQGVDYSTDSSMKYDIITKLSHDKSVEIGNTDFRFVRIDLLQKNTIIHLKEVRAILHCWDTPYKISFRCNDEHFNQKILEDENTPLLGKHFADQQISDYTITDQIEITTKFISLSKKEHDKSEFIDLCCNINSLYQSINNTERGKAYLDSAYQCINLSQNNIINANLCYLIGNYHFYKNDETQAFEFYRRGLEYCDLSEKSEIIQLKIIYRIAAFYNLKADKDGLKKYMEEMLSIANKNKSGEAYFITYPIIAAYYRTVCNDQKISDAEFYQYLDSVHYYDKKIVDLYESGEEEFKKAQASTMAKYYMNYAESTVIRNQSDWQKAIQAIDKSTDILLKADTMSLIRNLHVKSRIYFNQKKYDEAIHRSLESLEILKIYTGETYSGFYDVYSVLVDSYTGQKDYVNALKYEKLKSDVIKDMNEIEKYEKIKELETKYETAERELEIGRLNEEQQQILYNRMLMVGAFIILSIVLLLAWLYNRSLRLKKEKEAIILNTKIKEKEAKTQRILKESELKQMRNYLDGLETERTRLAKELHDVVANKLYILEQHLKKMSLIPESVQQQIEELYSQTRDISHDLISPSFQYVTLPEILFNHVEELRGRTNIQLYLNITDDYKFHNLPTTISHEIYRIAQECIGNAMKHSNAHNVWISLSFRSEIIRMIIKDDGIGFNSQKKTNGIGMQIIKERSRSLNGSLEIILNKGCEIILTIPIQLNADELQ